MVEKFSDFEGLGYLSEAGEFVFEIIEAELKDSKAGTPMVVLTAKCDKGQTTIYHSLNPKARWSYNRLIKACLNLNTPEKINTFECDYELIHLKLIGTKFIGNVEEEKYTKEVKKMLDDGTFEDGIEEKTSYKITEYKFL